MIAFIVLAGCQQPQLEPIGEAVGTGVAVGWAAAVAARADAEGSPTCVQRTPACSEDSCAGTVVIDLSDPECAFPLGERTTGTIEAVGSWTGGTALLALRFQDVDLDGGSLHAAGISAVTATVEDDAPEVDVIYVDQDIEGIDSGDLDIGQSGWSVQVDLAEGPSGATMLLDGGGQRVTGEADVAQLASVRTEMSPDCRLNPIAGVTTMERADGDADVAITGVRFRDTCDGMGKLEASLGRDALSSQKEFPIDLWVR